MTQISKQGAGSKRVCYRCVADEVVRKEIKLKGTRHSCGYCNARHRAIRLSELAHRVDEVYRQFVTGGEEMPVFDKESDKVHYEAEGETPSTIIQEMLECEPSLADDIVSFLHDRDRYGVIRDGDYDYYDDTSSYEVHIPDDPSFRFKWKSFCHSVKHERRFFNPWAKKQLDEILGRALAGGWLSKNPVRTIGKAGDSIRHIYRARGTTGPEDQKRIFASLARELGPPPPNLRKQGRMNAPGIAVFYGSLEPETCVAELRLPVGSAAVVGKFKIRRALRVLDMTAFDGGGWPGSLFDPNAVQNYAWVRFLQNFHAEIRRPVQPDSETLEYLPTQVVAEYLASMVKPRLDGILYASSQTTEKKLNIALFHHACFVKADSHSDTSRADEIEIDTDEEIITVTFPRKKRSRKRQPLLAITDAFDQVDVLPESDHDGEMDDPRPALELLRSDTEIRRIGSVDYRTEDSRVVLERKRGFNSPVHRDLGASEGVENLLR